MIRNKFVLGLAGSFMLFMLINCGGTGLFQGGSLAALQEQFLTACQDVPVAEYDDCMKAKIAEQDNLDSLTVGDLYRLFGLTPTTPETTDAE